MLVSASIYRIMCVATDRALVKLKSLAVVTLGSLSEAIICFCKIKQIIAVLSSTIRARLVTNSRTILFFSLSFSYYVDGPFPAILCRDLEFLDSTQGVEKLLHNHCNIKGIRID